MRCVRFSSSPAILVFTAIASICTVRAEAGSLVIPAWSFARGNVRVCANPDEFADAEPLVGNGPRQPWGWTVEYDVDFPVDADYSLHIRYAAAEARPLEVFFDNQDLGKCCNGVTFGSASSGQPDTFTWNSSGAKWESVYNYHGSLIKLSVTKGKHTLKFTRRGPLPHLVTLRLDTPAAFPESWQPPRYKVRDLDGIPAAYRKAFLPPSGVDVAALRRPIEDVPRTRTAGSLRIPAWTFDRGNARIYASPDQYADAGPLVGSEPAKKGSGTFVRSTLRAVPAKVPDPNGTAGCGVRVYVDWS